MYTPTDMEVFRICTLLTLVGMVFFTGAGSVLRGWGGGCRLWISRAIQLAANIRGEWGGGTDVSVNFGTQISFPAYAGWITPSPWKNVRRSRRSPCNSIWTRLLAMRIREQAGRRNNTVDLRSSATCSPTNRWLVIGWYDDQPNRKVGVTRAVQ